MNPINLIMSFIMAKSRASFYNIPESPELTNTALLAGLVADNPMLSYIIIDNKAKNDSNNLSTANASGTPTLTAGTETQSKEEGKDTGKNETATAASKEETLNVTTIEEIKNQIETDNNKLNEILGGQLAGIRTEIDTVKEMSTELKEAVAGLREIFDEIVKEAQNAPENQSAPKNQPATQIEAIPKKSAKPNQK